VTYSVLTGGEKRLTKRAVVMRRAMRALLSWVPGEPSLPLIENVIAGGLPLLDERLLDTSPTTPATPVTSR
jgi:hypothetical protein